MENNEEILRRMERQLADLAERDDKRRTRNIILWVCVIAALAVLVIVLLPKINSFIESYNNSLVILDKVVESLDGIDPEELSETLKAVSEIDTEKLRSIIGTVNEISELLEPIKGLFSK